MHNRIGVYMNRLQRPIICVFLSFILFGCNGGNQKILQKCPGKTNVTEALAALQSQSQNMIPISTKGKFSIELYYKEDIHKHHFNITAFIIKPPDEIYMQASTGVISKAVETGSNEHEFWFAIRPEVDTYWWGFWAEQETDTGLMINPGFLLEALGIAEIDTRANWSLSNDGIYDVLTKTVNGVTTKILHVYCLSLIHI